MNKIFFFENKIGQSHKALLLPAFENGTYFQTSTKNSYNTFDDKFTEDDGFQIAIGILDFTTGDYSDHLNRTLEEQV